MTILTDHKNGKASFRIVEFTMPTSLHYFCKAGPYSATFVDDEPAAIAWCVRHKAVKRRAAFASGKAIVRPNLSAPDPQAPLTRHVPRDSSNISQDKHAAGKKKVRTF